MLYLYHQRETSIYERGGAIMFRRFLFWLRRDSKSKDCRSLCVTCPYYDVCRLDVPEGKAS